MLRSVWLCSRNDALGNVAVLAAAAGVWQTTSAWPDLDRRQHHGRAVSVVFEPNPTAGLARILTGNGTGHCRGHLTSLCRKLSCRRANLALAAVAGW